MARDRIGELSLKLSRRGSMTVESSGARPREPHLTVAARIGRFEPVRPFRLVKWSGFGDAVLFGQRTTLIEIIETYWPVLACSFLVSVIATPLCRVFALRRKIVDRPDDFLKPHRTPVPYLGGVAIFLGWVAGVVLATTMFSDSSFVDGETQAGPSMPRVMMVGIIVGGAAIMLIGLLDDLHIMSPITKLAFAISPRFSGDCSS